MTLHLIKLCIGAPSPKELKDWQTARLAEKRKLKQKPELVHVTRMTPSRSAEILDGGSIYWVMKGVIRCRQKLVGIEPFTDHEGVKRCKLVLDKDIVLVRRRDKRAFQGWRYLTASDAPPDARGAVEDDMDDMPEAMRRELEEMGLL